MLLLVGFIRIAFTKEVELESMIVFRFIASGFWKYSYHKFILYLYLRVFIYLFVHEQFFRQQKWTWYRTD